MSFGGYGDPQESHETRRVREELAAANERIRELEANYATVARNIASSPAKVLEESVLVGRALNRLDKLQQAQSFPVAEVQWAAGVVDSILEIVPCNGVILEPGMKFYLLPAISGGERVEVGADDGPHAPAESERIRELEDALKFKLAELELMVRSRSSIKELLITEREVSDKLEKALEMLVQSEEDGNHFCASGLPLWAKARDTLVEVATLRNIKNIL